MNFEVDNFFWSISNQVPRFLALVPSMPQTTSPRTLSFGGAQITIIQPLKIYFALKEDRQANYIKD